MEEKILYLFDLEQRYTGKLIVDDFFLHKPLLHSHHHLNLKTKHLLPIREDIKYYTKKNLNITISSYPSTISSGSE